MGEVMQYMKSLADADDGLTFDEDNDILYHKEATRGDQVRAFVIADANGSKLPLRSLTKFIGKGMLGGIIASDSEVELQAQPREPSQHATDTDASSAADVKESPDAGIVCLQAGPAIAWQSQATPPSSDFEVVNIDDIVGPVVTSDQLQNDLYPDLPRSGALLVAKICGALSSMKYDAVTIHKVGRLVNTNMMTAVHYEGLPLEDSVKRGEAGWVEERAKNVLSSLLDRDQERTRSVNMNSNEPVLLINSFGGLNDEDMQVLADIVNGQLQKQWNIWPVRVYSGPYLELPEHSPFREYGFSISLLNVVNTEIGGPSMVQLLDHECDAKSYLGQLRRDERHHKGEMKMFVAVTDRTYQHEAQTFEASTGIAVATESDASSDGSVAGSVSDDDDVAEATTTFEAPEEDIARPIITRTEAPMPASEEEEHADTRAHFHERSQTSGPSIQHPTWTHASGEESLLDLIRRQASNTKGSDEDEDDADTTSDRSSPSASEARSEEGFVVV